MSIVCQKIRVSGHLSIPISREDLCALPDNSVIGIVQKVFSEKASAIARIKNASEMRQKCVKTGLILLGKEERSKMDQKRVKNAWNTFGGNRMIPMLLQVSFLRLLQ